MDNCCCGGQNDCSEDIPRCGNQPKVVEMTGKWTRKSKKSGDEIKNLGEDAEIICGEWQTGDTPRNSSAEEYNIILEIKSITRHPDYTVNSEPSFLSNDIAVFKVDDGPLASSVSKTFRLHILLYTVHTLALQNISGLFTSEGTDLS